ncbi:tyrosine-protein phosphatase [Nocardia sp. CA2R105]|uniref:tyrosine-protein phosphatase n=1 Tax=Nocardia coffeae TaxID=2873381 RepID=UPI001CA74043|nr:tyrosine-protein phosphatase [Nocardia coffeae]MBY8861198.1 tyrosine-protein phosphatase [Nocardia coffeae]
MTQSAACRRLPVGNTYNLRDIGDYQVADGARTGWGRLFRSDATRFTAGADLADLGLRTVIDLRDDVEVTALPTGLDAFVPNVLRRALDPRSLVSALSANSPDPLGDLYVALLHERGAELTTIVADLARPGALPALVHCAAGKDRTGVVIALVLSAIGVPDDVVATDYALTADYLTAEFFAALPTESGAADPADAALHGARPESMTAMLRVLSAEYGGARAFLTGHGLPNEAIDHLHTALTH